MDANQIKELMRLISESNFIEFEIEQEGFKLRLIKAGARETAPAASNGPLAPVVVTVPAASAHVEPPPAAPDAAAPAAAPAPAAPAPDPAEAREGLHEVRSPIVGTFYRSPNPDAAPFVSVGDRVKAGQVLCIIEAMKLMNEIECDVAGEVAEVVAANGQPVEYGETLFRVRPL